MVAEREEERSHRERDRERVRMARRSCCRVENSAVREFLAEFLGKAWPDIFILSVECPGD